MKTFVFTVLVIVLVSGLPMAQLSDRNQKISNACFVMVDNAVEAGYRMAKLGFTLEESLNTYRKAQGR